MAEQVSGTGSANATHVVTSPGSGQIVSQVQPSNLQISAAAKPQLVVQSPQQQVLILPPGSTTIPQTQLSQISIRQPSQNNVQLIGQSSVQVVNQPAGPVTVVSQGPATGSQMFYIVSPTRSVTTSTPQQALVSGNKVIISAAGSPRADVSMVSRNVKQLAPAKSAVETPQPITQQTLVVKSPPSISTISPIVQGTSNTTKIIPSTSQNVSTLMGQSSQQTAVVPNQSVVVSQGAPLLTAQASPQKLPAVKVVPKATGNTIVGQNQGTGQPVTLQLKITDPSLIQKLGLQQGKGHVLSLTGMNLNQLLASQKVQLVGQSNSAVATTGSVQPNLAQNIKLGGAVAAGSQATGNTSLQTVPNLLNKTIVLPQTSSNVVLKTVSSHPVSTTTTVTTTVSTASTSQQQPITVFSNQKGQQQIVMLKQQTVSSSQPSQGLSVVGSPQAGTQRVLIQGGQKVSNSIPGGVGASFVIGNRQISSIVPQSPTPNSGVTNLNPVQKRITLSPSSSGIKNTLAVHNQAPTAVVKLPGTPQKVVTASSAGSLTKSDVPAVGMSAVSAELKAASESSTGISPSNVKLTTGSTVTSLSTVSTTTTAVKPQNTVVVKKTDTSVTSASSSASTVVTSVTTPTTTASLGGQSSQNFVSKFIRILPPKPGQKQTQMVISVNPNTDVNSEVKEISKELAQLQSQPKTHDTLKKLQDLQTRLQQLQVVTQLIKKAKMGQQSGSGGSAGVPGSASSPTDSKERKKIIKQYKLQEKANRIVAEAVQKAKAAGKVDIPNVNSLELPPIPSGAEEEEEEERKKKKKDKSRSKSKKSKDSKKKDSKDKKNRDKEKRQQAPSKKKQPSKKLPAAAVLKLKRQKRKRGEECSDTSDLDETPPRSPVTMYVDQDGEVMQRRSARNTTRKKYTEDYDFKITDDESSSSSDNEGKESSKKSKKKTSGSQPVKPVLKSVKVKQEVEENLEVDVESVEPSASVQGTQFFVENPDEDEANIIEKILAYRTRKKPQLPGEAQVGEVEEFLVKYRNFSYMHCEWQTVDKMKDPRIHQKVKRFRQKLRHMTPTAFQQMEEEPFNPDYIEVDRVLDEAVTQDETTGEDVTHYLVKWCSLPYEDSTWELAADVLNSKIDFFHKIQKVPSPEERTRKAKAKSVDWEKLPVSPEYKDNNKLRDYQLEGVNWLMFSWCNGQNCILADEMGLGKTIQSIGFLMEVVKFGIIGPFLVIAPLSTIANWQREVETWTDLNSVVYHGSAQSRHMIAEFEMFHKDDKGDKIPNCFKFQVLITTYEILLADCQELSEIEWRVVIIDEAHRLKNRNCKLLEGLKILDVEHRVLLTGTPLQNNVEELFSLLNFLEPGRFRSLSQFLDDFGDLKTESQVERLQQLLKPMMLRRLKEDVEKTLAPKEETIIEVELTSIQKRYYRAILERNFSFLQKGANSTSNLPNLMNTMMELRKCCNHPFLINGAEDQIMLEMNPTGQHLHESLLIHLKALIQSSGKMVLLDKLLPKLKEGGHKVLIFSQMIRCLDILEDYLVQKRYLFERIDGRVRGNMRQAAIDRFSKPDSDRFIFLLCTRAGGLGINLTAADTCIIFDSDWNPQNDLQAQARCHRIGQSKAVKVYRLITRNSYEREMFDKASMKLGLDKAVLQSMRADKDAVNAQQPLTKTEIEDLLRKGAYGAIMEDDESSSKFCEEDIEMILKRRTKVIQIESGVKGSTFAKASFTVASDHADIKIDDPDFWQKWAKKADIQIRDSKEDKIIMAPRQRKQTRRYGGNDMTELSSSDEEVAPKEEKPSKKQLQSGWTRLECFRVEKGLLTFGWGCWEEILATTRFRRRLGEKDIEAISRTMLIYCLQHYKGDENIKSFIWDLVTPGQDGTPKDVKQHKGLSVLVPRGGRKSKKPKKEEPVVPCILEFDFTNKDKNAEQLLTDEGYKNHLKRHCNKVLLRVRLLYYLRHEIIGPMARQIEEGTPASDLNFNIPPPEGEKPIAWWDTKADKSLLVGVFKHGYEKYHLMRLDSCLCFLERCGRPRQDELAAQSQVDGDVMNDSQLDVDGIEQDTSAIPTIPKHIKEEVEGESASPVSTRPSSPATPSTSKRKSAPLIPSEPGKLPFPQAPDLNTRVRRLVAGFQREQKKKQLKEAKREKKDQVKKLRMQEQLRLREMRKVEGAQKWSRREESDFYRILAAFGVEQDPVSGQYNWTNFKKLAKLERKYDNRMQEFYEHYRAMCLRVCKREDEIPADFAQKPPLDFQIEPISEERASKCLQRIDLLLKVRNQVLPHAQLEERLKLCQKSVELPEWWEPGKHDKDLLLGVSRYGINRMESQQMMMNDPQLSFKELKEKYPQMGMPPPGAFTTKPKGEAKKKKKPAKGPASKEDVKAKVDGDTVDQTAGALKVESGAKMMELKRPPLDIKSEPHLDENGALNLSKPLKDENKDNGNTGVDKDTIVCKEEKEGFMHRDTKDLQDASQDREGEELGNTQVQTNKEVDGEKVVMNNDTGNNLSKTENGESPAKGGASTKQMSEAEILYTYILRWPKDRVIVHRLEQISVCILKGMWPGRKHHPPPLPVPADPMMLGLDRPPMPLEHSYAGEFLGSKYMEMDEPIPLRKKKKKKKQIFEDPGKPDAASYEVYRLLVGADSQGDREVVKKRRRKEKDGSSEIEGEELDADGKVKRKRKKEKWKVDANTGLPVQSEDSQEEAAPPPKKRKRLKDPATLRMEDITGEEKVGIIEQATGYVLPAKRVPLLKDVAQWIMKHPRYSIAFEWGEIVIKKGFLPPQLYHRISKTPSAQRAVHFPPYQTRASSSASPLEGSVPLNNLEEMVHVMPASVPLAPSLPIPTREAPSESLIGKKQKKKAKAKQACIPQPIAPAPSSSLPGISPYLLPSTGGVLYSPFLASQGVLQPSGNVLMPAQTDFSVKSSSRTEEAVGSPEMELEETNERTVVSQEPRVQESREIHEEVEAMEHSREIDGREEESEDDDDVNNEEERVRAIKQEYEAMNYDSDEDGYEEDENEVRRSDDDDDDEMEEDGGNDSDGEDVSDNEDQEEEEEDYGEYQIMDGGDSDDDDAEPFLEDGEDDDDDDDDADDGGDDDGNDEGDDDEDDESAGNPNSDSDNSNNEYNDVDDDSDDVDDDDSDDENDDE